jgi:SAM-dependent methyltransferase
MGHAVVIVGPQPEVDAPDRATAGRQVRIPDPASMPWPGDELIYRVTGYTDRTTFYNSGHQSVQDLEAVLAVAGRSLATFPRILDFGCGCGRILIWLEDLGAVSSLHGVDIDARAVAWAQDNIGWAECKVNQPLPPLDYSDGFFDLVFSHSVFTHIDEHYQDAWLDELRRVVKPGGYVMLSIHGEAVFTTFEKAVAGRGGDPSVIRRELGARGISFIKDDAFTGGPFPDFYHSTFHAPWYVFEHWGRWFDVVAFLPQRSMNYQDFVLLRRPEDGADPSPEDVAANGHVAPIVRGSATAADVSTGAGAAETALYRAGRLLHEGVDLGGPPPGLLGKVGRRLEERLLGAERVQREVNVHQQEVDRALFTALWELDSTVSAATRSGGVPLTELNVRLWDAIRLQGERINRLENDLWEALRVRPPVPAPDADADPAAAADADPAAGAGGG